MAWEEGAVPEVGRNVAVVGNGHLLAREEPDTAGLEVGV
jgi:hypothetical protein